VTSPERRRYALLPRLGIGPSVPTLVRAEIDAAIRAAEGRDGPGSVSALDAGCGRVSLLRPFRKRIGRLVGADLHPPAAGALAYLDEFVTVDLCAATPDAFEPASFDVILSSFTIEHFSDPAAAFRSFRHWLRPGGVLVATTVNRRHPFVAAYLDAPAALRDRVQPVVKRQAADAHPIVGVCNDPASLETALRAAGFGELRVACVSHLARAWGRTVPTFALGLIGDVLARAAPSRRSTIIAVARA
jgi:SAM-dependent methyltransferase